MLGFRDRFVATLEHPAAHLASLGVGAHLDLANLVGRPERVPLARLHRHPVCCLLLRAVHRVSVKVPEAARAGTSKRDAGHSGRRSGGGRLGRVHVGHDTAFSEQGHVADKVARREQGLHGGREPWSHGRRRKKKNQPIHSVIIQEFIQGRFIN